MSFSSIGIGRRVHPASCDQHTNNVLLVRRPLFHKDQGIALKKIKAEHIVIALELIGVLLFVFHLIKSG